MAERFAATWIGTLGPRRSTNDAFDRMGERMILSCWFVCALLSLPLASGVSTASSQDAPVPQAQFEGLWTWLRLGGPAETLLDYVAEGLLTAEAEAYRSAWDILEDDDQASCQRRSPASFAGSAYDLEIFVREGVVFLIAAEQVRRVYTDGREKPVGFWPNKLGWSEGHWEGKTLVVRTTDFTEGTIDGGNRPLAFGSPAAEILERYTLSEDGTGLHVNFNIADPKYYVAPIEVQFDYVRSDKTVVTVDCVPSVY